MPKVHLVTGAFGYTGRHIARLLLEAGLPVRTLTASPGKAHPFGDRVEVHPLDFEDGPGLQKALAGVEVLYNTYWVRFSRAGFSQELAVRNTKRLFQAALKAGVTRVVHVSITNPSKESPYEYFRGKARLEEALKETGLSHAILRPAVLFGEGDILVNNIAWMLRKFPVFGLFGNGRYRLQPIFVEDFAKLAFESARKEEDLCIDAVGPETFAYRDLVATLGEAIGRQRPMVALPVFLGRFLAWAMGMACRDVVLTGEEIGALMDDLLVTPSPPAGETRLSVWVRENASRLGRRYASELARRRGR